MNLSRTAVMLIAVLALLICVSAYLWFFLGMGKPEIDPRVGSLRQSFTCEHCGNTFTMTTEEVGQMRRSRGQVYCPKCGAGGARKEISPVPASPQNDPTSRPAAGRDSLPPASPVADGSDDDGVSPSSVERQRQSTVMAEDQLSD